MKLNKVVKKGVKIMQIKKKKRKQAYKLGNEHS